MKQINLIGINFKEVFKWSGWVLLFIVLFFMKTCSPEPSVAKIEIPEKKGKFEGKKPDHVEITPENVHDKEDVYIKGENVYIENPIDEKLLEQNDALIRQFKKVDSINKQLLYERAITINKFSTVFDDENLTLNIEGIVRGEVQEITPSYTIKSKTIDVPVKVKKEVFSLKAGAEIGNNKQFESFIYKGNVFINNFSVSIDNKENYYIGYSIPIFSIKK